MRAHDAAAAGAAILGLAAASSAAADPPELLKAAPGVPVPLVVESGTQPDCSIGAPPAMRVVIPPAHGELTLREGALKRRGSACPASPGYVVIYVPDDDFNGDDTVTIEVVENGDPTTLAFDISIMGKIAAPDDGA